MEHSYTSNSPSETTLIGHKLGRLLSKKNVVICFYGNLAAGKTTFIKGLVNGAIDYPSDQVNSPTFTYLNIYETVHHFDLYRLNNEDEFLSMGFDDFLTEGICCIEWADRLQNIIPPQHISITISHDDEDKRVITIKNNTPLAL